jgi:hypothetical protein
VFDEEGLKLLLMHAPVLEKGVGVCLFKSEY